MHKISLNTNSNQGIVLHKLIRRYFKNKSHCIIVNGCVVSSCCCTVIEWLSQDRQRLADSAIWCKINDSKCRRKKGRKKGRENGRKAAFVCACAVGCHCAAGTTLLTSILVEISRDFMPETCRKQNAPRACSHSSHLRASRADLLETTRRTTWFITSLTTTIAVCFGS